MQANEVSFSRFDRFLLYKGMKTCELPRSLVEEWTSKRTNESPTTHRIRFHVTRRFAEFMRRRGYAAFVPDPRQLPVKRTNFIPHIFTHDEIRRLFVAADNLASYPFSPLRPIIMPELFSVVIRMRPPGRRGSPIDPR